ncbi:bifunctional folylpolyglutamate synthase/dihydrofolate synthase [Psychrobacter sp. I-STPA10]|uniref:bifunctional folylpolyglutamate synthase/dihydrofolate synthase n=1 Tax=Psychrobacter sp. I-STPA10 TaxID=2585769 RepID=UPI001E488A3F|nr:folylpolyglutamate synthase/dihydrofolate synthase family protein [Psychrobacter sp. I-STPA10]
MTTVDTQKPVEAPNQNSSLSQWLIYMQQIHVSAIDMGLSRVIPVAEHLNLLQSAKDNAYVFMVAGTNGKGSTTAVIAEICQQAGYKTALYQSPHLVDFNERVRINGQAVGDDKLVQAFYQIEQARIACELTLSFFEMTTLAAMLIFAEADCDVWVLEVGLGGRLDVVNIIDADMCVITNIAIDHVDWLGDTREQIGYEKAGILRQDSTLIYGEADMPNSVRQKITELNVTCYQTGQDFIYCDSSDDLGDISSLDWQYSGAALTLQLPKPSLSLVNTSNAISAVLASPLNIAEKHIISAMQQVKLMGRFDARQLADRQWLFDVAHNEQGMAFLLPQFEQFWQAYLTKHPTAKLYIIFSMLADKPIDAVVSQLISLPIKRWVVAAIDHSRAASLDELMDILAKHIQVDDIVTTPNLTVAARQAIAQSQENDMILVCGSFHTIGEVLTGLSISTF